MRKEFKEHIKNINRLVNLSLTTAKIRKITIEEEEKPFSLRPQLHVILRAPTGSMKSTILRAIAEPLSLDIHDSITSPGLVGTIDGTTKQFIPGSAWMHRNSLLLMDEFRFRRKSDDWQVFLKLLEDQQYGKKIGIFTSDKYEKEDDLELKIKNSAIHMKTRFAAIIGTMKRLEAHRGDDFKAFVARCLTYEYSLNLDELEYIMTGKKFIDIRPKEPKKEITISSTKYLRILRFVKKQMPRDSTGMENFARITGDLIRIHAAENNFNRKFAHQVIDWKISTYKKIGSYFRTKEEK